MADIAAEKPACGECAEYVVRIRLESTIPANPVIGRMMPREHPKAAERIAAQEWTKGEAITVSMHPAADCRLIGGTAPGSVDFTFLCTVPCIVNHCEKPILTSAEISFKDFRIDPSVGVEFARLDPVAVWWYLWIHEDADCQMEDCDARIQVTQLSPPSAPFGDGG
jgi:hypothetical protein